MDHEDATFSAGEDVTGDTTQKHLAHASIAVCPSNEQTHAQLFRRLLTMPCQLTESKRVSQI